MDLNNGAKPVLESIAQPVKIPIIFSIVVKGWSEYAHRIQGKLRFRQQFSTMQMLRFICLAGVVDSASGYFGWLKY